MKTCCIIVVSKLKVVLQMCLQTISSVLSSDGHLKPVCVSIAKFNLGSLHIIMNIVIRSLFRLQVCAICLYESYFRAFECPLKITKKLVQNITSFRGCGLE